MGLACSRTIVSDRVCSDFFLALNDLFLWVRGAWTKCERWGGLTEFVAGRAEIHVAGLNTVSM